MAVALHGGMRIPPPILCLACAALLSAGSIEPLARASAAASPTAKEIAAKTAAPLSVGPPRRPRAVGITIDVLPIALSASAGDVGASGQLWFGIDHLRFRVVGARISFPNWLSAKDGFEDQRTLVGAALVDYVFGNHFDKWWIGTGVEGWHNTIGHQSIPGAMPGERASWNTLIWTAGGGYIFPIVGNFYLEPWGAGHVALTSERPTIGSRTFQPQRVTGEVSLKAGYFFDL